MQHAPNNKYNATYLEQHAYEVNNTQYTATTITTIAKTIKHIIQWFTQSTAYNTHTANDEQQATYNRRSTQRNTQYAISSKQHAINNEQRNTNDKQQPTNNKQVMENNTR